MLIPNSLKQLQLILDQAKKLAPYKPNEEVNQFFSDLYKMSVINSCELSSQIINSQELCDLHSICSQAEYQMEQYRVNRLLHSKDIKNELEKFPYRNNYADLTKLEYHSILSQLESCKNLLFVGSWPLPLTAIILTQKYDMHCVLVERDEIAVQTSQKIIEKLWLQRQIEVIHSDFLNFSNNTPYDAIILASLLFCWGETDKKILSHLTSQLNFQLAVIRSVEWVRQLLYQKVNLDLIKTYLNLEVSIHPNNHIVNSLLLCTNKK